MQTYSQAFHDAISAADRDIRGYIKFNGTFTLDGAGGLISFKTTQNAMDAERFCVGSVCSAMCEATFYNEGLEGSGVSLANCYFDAYIGAVTDPDNNTVEYICCGRYYVSEITRSTATTKIVGYDIAGRLSMDYVPTVTADPDHGYLAMDILNDIIDQTGVNGGDPFTQYGDSTYVPEIFLGNCRAQWGWLCSLIDGTASSYSGSRDATELGYMKKFVAGNGVLTPYAVDENTTYMDGLLLGDEYTITSFTSGTSDDPIVVGNGTGLYGLNPYMTTAIATTIEGTMDGYQYYPATLHWRGDPCLDILDEINVTKGEGTFKVVVMKIETTFNGGLEQTISCFGDSEAYYALSTSPTQGAINRVSSLVQDIQQAIETADGGVITKVLDTDGTWKELVIANNQDLSQATSVWRFNINGLAHANRYSGGTYTLAMDTQGRIVANVIQTGILQDANGYNSWNLDTGALTITNGSVNITTSDETDDIIQFNGDSRNAQGLGFTYHTQMQPLKFRAEGHFYTPTAVTTDHVGWADMSVNGGTGITGKLDLAGGEMSKEHEGYVNFAYILSLNYGGVYGRFYREYQGIDRTVFSLTGSGVRFFDSSETLTAEYLPTGLKLYNSSGTIRQTVDENGAIEQFDSNGKLRTYLEYGDIYLKNASEVTRTRLNSQGILHQFDADGKKRTALEWGDLYLLDSTEATRLRASGGASGGYVKLFDASGTTQAQLLQTGLSFYTASGKTTLTAGTYNSTSGILYLYDGSTTSYRAYLDYGGLVFRNTSGTVQTKLTTLTSSAWNSGRAGAALISSKQPASTGDYHPLASVKAYSSDWAIGVLNNDLYFVNTMDANYGGSNRACRYKLAYADSSNAFLTPDILTTINTAAYVKAQGTYGGWQYRRWSNKFFECWYTIAAASRTFSAWGNAYYSPEVGGIDYPTTFASVPYEYASPTTGSAWVYLAGGDTAQTTTKSGGYRGLRPVSGAATFGIKLYVAGYSAYD